jgi:hypothetical protein
MEKENLIAVKDFCIYHELKISFIENLKAYGLIELQMVGESDYISESDLPTLERYVSFYRHLEINFEGMEAITYLLERIESMQREITALKNKLRFYETGHEHFAAKRERLD